eukprot:TRINITY_DN37125_c0_g1_i1.p1 TRINITY_DN37125_c0_g1~~TRINITY_DN37125_c0_g1_i1.p1  ORF type:complete len:276 (-),score=25.06 TRINITY_DN37125_c0_g1_i1:85-891(-)
MAGAWPIVEVEAVMVLLISGYNFNFIHNVGMYRSILSWQFTIVSLHIAPMLAIQALRPNVGVGNTAYICWSLFSWGLRRFEVSIFSLAFLIIELCSGFGEHSSERLEALVALQMIISCGAWGGMLAASCFADFTFAPMDRHLHKGFKHMRSCRGAQRCFFHEFASHFLAQLTFADLLRRRLGRLPDLAAASFSAGVALGCYICLVLLAAVLIPPHQLPYNLGGLPKWIQFPCRNLPGYLVADGARGTFDSNKLPWWMQVTATSSDKPD